MNVYMKDPSKVKEMIINAGFSLNGFCKKIDVSQPMLSKILRGEHNPYPPLAKKIANGLGLEIKDIFFTSLACKKRNKKEAVKQ